MDKTNNVLDVFFVLYDFLFGVCCIDAHLFCVELGASVLEEQS